MKRTDARVGLALGLVAVVLSASGCWFLLGAGAGAAVYAYVEGEGKKVYGASMERVQTAVLAALKDMGMVIIHQDRDATSAKIKASDPDHSDVKVNLFRESESVTTVAVRIGVFGDERLTKAIFEKIDRRLGVKPS